MRRFIIICISWVLGSLFAQVKDIDNNTYQAIAIGSQQWLSSNLNVSKFRNGDTIPECKNYQDWTTACMNGKPAFCYCSYNSKNGVKYAKLYNWYAVIDERGLAPTGWRTPNTIDLNRLCKYLGGEQSAGYLLKSTSGWSPYTWDYGGSNKGETNGNGNDSLGFNAKPAGYYHNVDGFIMLGKWTGFWLNDPGGYKEGKGFYLSNGNKNVLYSNFSVYSALSVRCIKE